VSGHSAATLLIELPVWSFYRQHINNAPSAAVTNDTTTCV